MNQPEPPTILRLYVLAWRSSAVSAKEKRAPERDLKLDASLRRAFELSGGSPPKRSAPDQAGFANPVPFSQPDRDKSRWARRE